MKKTLSAIWNEFIYGGFLAALGPVFMVWSILIVMSISPDYWLLLFLYLISALAYLFDNLKDNYNKTNNLLRNLYLFLSPAFVLISLIIIYVIKIDNLFVLLLTLFLALLSVSYNLYFKQFTRFIIGFKSYYVVLMFLLMILFIPLFYKINVNESLILLSIFFAFRCFSNTVFCDIKDKEDDKKNQLLTFPVFFSRQKLFTFLLLMNLISIIPIVYGVAWNTLPLFAVLLILVSVYYQIYLKYAFSNPTLAKMISAVFADGEAFVWIVLLLIGRQI